MLIKFSANFLKPEKLELEKFWKFETQKTQTRIPKRWQNSNRKKYKLDQALDFKNAMISY